MTVQSDEAISALRHPVSVALVSITPAEADSTLTCVGGPPSPVWEDHLHSLGFLTRCPLSSSLVLRKPPVGAVPFGTL